MSEVETDPTVFSLVFAGLEEDSPEVLQRLKGVFIADLDLSVPEVQEILEHGRGVVCTGSAAAELEEKRKLLIAAGAQVHIVAPANQVKALEDPIELVTDALLSELDLENAYGSQAEEISDAHTDLDSDTDLESDFEEDEDSEDEDPDYEDDEDFELEFDLDLTDVFERKPEPKKKRSTVHVLDIDAESLSLDDTLSELGLEPDPEPVEAVSESQLQGERNPEVEELSLEDTLDSKLSSAAEAHAVLVDTLTDETENENSRESVYSAPGLDIDQDLDFLDATESEELNASDNKPVQNSSSARVNEQGIIPVTEIKDAPLFELTAMDDVVASTPATKTIENKPTEPAPETSDAFSDLSLQPELESNVIDPLQNELSEDTEMDLSLSPDPDYDEETLEFHTNEVSTPEVVKEASGAGNSLFSGVDLDAMLDSVVETASTDLKQAGIEFEEYDNEEPLSSQKSASAESREIAHEKNTPNTTDKSPQQTNDHTIGNTELQSESGAHAAPLGSMKHHHTKAEEVAQATDDVEEAEVQKQKRESKIPLDVLAGIILGILILGAGNWFYFTESKLDNELEQSRIQRELEEVQSQVIEKQKTLEAQAAMRTAENVVYSNVYSGQFKENGILIKGKAQVGDKAITLSALTLRGPKPPELTDKEVIDGVEPHPWLAKVEVDGEVIPLGSRSTFTKKVPVKVFITHKSVVTRVVTEGTLQGSIDTATRRMKVSISVAQGLPAISEKTGAIIQKTGADTYAYAMRGSVYLKAEPKDK